jgi:DNA repair exonuclease SbcCD ATPase subunit
MQRLLAAALSLLLTACPTTNPLSSFMGGTDSGAPELTAAEKQLQEDEKRFYSTMMGGAAVGALAGAGAGLLACSLAGYRDQRLRNCVIATTAAGGLVGGVDGYVTGKREAAGRDELRATQATVADVRQDNEKMKSFLSNSNQVLVEGQARLTALRRDVQTRKVSAAEADEARQREERNIASMAKTLEQAKQNRSNYIAASKKLNGDVQSKRQLDAEIERMNQQIAQLERTVNDYNRALAVSRA